MIHFAEHANNSTVINARNQYGKKIVEECRVFLKVECKGLVVAIKTSAEVLKLKRGGYTFQH